MVNLQEFLEEQFPNKEDVRAIKIDNEIESEYRNKLKNINGDDLDLSVYSNLEALVIDGNYLQKPLTSLKLGRQEQLKELVIINNHLTNLDISQCPDLERLDDEAIYESEVFTILKGWENTKLVPVEYHEGVRDLQKQKIELQQYLSEQQVQVKKNY